MPDIQQLRKIWTQLEERHRLSRILDASIINAEECVVCHRVVRNLLKHAYGHIRRNEAYGVRAWNAKTRSSTLRLVPTKRKLTWKQLTRLQKRFEKGTSALIDGRKLRLMERQSVILIP
jgi:hypothetical protein